MYRNGLEAGWRLALRARCEQLDPHPEPAEGTHNLLDVYRAALAPKDRYPLVGADVGEAHQPTSWATGRWRPADTKSARRRPALR